MASDWLSSQVHAFDTRLFEGAAENWRDEFWTALIGAVDKRLRHYYGIYEFTGDDRCILRIAIERTPASVMLSDGTCIERGAAIGALHLWNDQLLRFSERGPDLAWACMMRRRLVHSLLLLATHIKRDPQLEPVSAFRARAVMATRLGLARLDRVAERHGFEAIAIPPSLFGPLQTIGDCINVWCLTRAFNPGALPRQRWRRQRQELWISRPKLVRTYSTPAAPVRARSRIATKRGKRDPVLASE